MISILASRVAAASDLAPDHIPARAIGSCRSSLRSGTARLTLEQK
jgi:hypothetical protein